MLPMQERNLRSMVKSLSAVRLTLTYEPVQSFIRVRSFDAWLIPTLPQFKPNCRIRCSSDNWAVTHSSCVESRYCNLYGPFRNYAHSPTVTVTVEVVV